MVIIFKTVIFTFFILCNILGYSQFFKKILKINDQCILNNFLYGSIFIAFCSFLINFFLPLSELITNSFFVFFTIIGVSYFIKNLNYLYKYALTVLLILLLITIYSPSYNDYELYHLPYMELVRKFKIIFGLSNFDFRYAHTSVFQNISAFQYNSLMKLDSYIFYTPVLTILTVIFISKKVFTTNNIYIFVFSLVTVVYYMLHASRYGSLGNDYPTHILGILLIIQFLEAKNQKKPDYFIILIIASLIIASKFSMIFFAIIPLYFFLKTKSFFLNIKKIKVFFILVFASLFFAKNFINSSCLVYPIPSLCFETKWLSDEYSFGSAETISTESSVMVKSYMEIDEAKRSSIYEQARSLIDNDKKISNIYKNLDEYSQNNFLKHLAYKEYLKLDNWLENYLTGKDFHKFLEKNIILNLIILIIFFVTIKKHRIKKIILTKSIRAFSIEEAFIIFFIFFNLVFWFFNFPQLRYGISYTLLSCSFPIIFFLLNYNFSDNKIVFCNLAKYLFLISFIYLLFSNFVRIYEANNKFDNSLSESVNIVNIQPPNQLKLIYVPNMLVKKPINGVCSNIQPLCSVFAERLQLSGRGIYINSLNYMFIY